MYPKEKPFVYQNKIEIENPELTRDERSVLTSRLTTQLDDSMAVNIKQSFLLFKRLIDPAVFDTAYAEQSVKNMEIFLKTAGYYNGKVSYKVSKIDTVHKKNPKKKQIRVYTTFNVKTGPVFRVSEFEYFLADSALQKIACENVTGSLVKFGEPFSEALVNAEVDRLIEIFQNKGYYKITKDQFYINTDTVFRKLLNPPSDPLELFEVLQEARERRLKPVIEVYIKTKPLPKLDTNNLRFFTIRNVTVYPEYNSDYTDSLQYNTTVTKKGIIIKSLNNRFKTPFIARNILLKPGSVYSAAEVNRTANELNNLGIWQFIKIQPTEIIRPDTSQLDIDFLLQPARKLTFTTDLESVFNSPITQAVQAGNLVGVGLNLGLTIKNFAKQGILFNNTLRGGVEFGVGAINPGLQSTEITYNNSFSIPKVPKLFTSKKNRESTWTNKKTFITTTISTINRNINGNGLFELTTVSSNYGWQFQTKKKELWTLRPLNIEYVNLFNTSAAFDDLLRQSPFLQNSFTTGLVVGTFNASFFKPSLFASKKYNHTNSIRLSFEESGAILGRIKNQTTLKNLFEYVKLDIEFKYQISKPKTAWVFRTFAGAGYLYGDDNSNMPFFKQYTGGGPNSMRAWPLRSIGPGAKPLDARSVSERNQFFTRTGDIIFETNLEYRYNIANIWPGTLVLRGAVFTDIGNIWNFRKKGNAGNDTVVFEFKDFYRDLSVSAGTGLRLDFIGLFLLRFDFGLRMKYPDLPSLPNDGWRNPKIQILHFVSGTDQARNWRYDNFNFSLGINYPF